MFPLTVTPFLCSKSKYGNNAPHHTPSSKSYEDIYILISLQQGGIIINIYSFILIIMAEVPQENDIISVSSTSSEEDYKEDEEAAAATVAAAAMSIPPRRSTRSYRVSLSPSNTETTITETRSSDEIITSYICSIYDVIKHDGWMKPRNGKLFDWIFVPPAVNKLIQDKEITYKDLLSKGTDGDHYADGWMKLGEMFLTYGTNHAPKNLSRTPPNPLLEGYTIERLYKELICEVPAKPAAASKSTESVGVGDTFTPVGKGNFFMQLAYFLSSESDINYIFDRFYFYRLHIYRIYSCSFRSEQQRYQTEAR